MTNDWILVGVDGGEGGETAVRYAARAAARMGLGLRLLHVAPELAYTLAVDPDTAPGGLPQREKVLIDATEIALEVMGPGARGRVVTDLAYGGRVARLLEAATRCRLVVLGDQPRPLLDRLVTGSVLTGVAAKAPVPVIGVPAGCDGADAHGRVVAAVKWVEEWEPHFDRALAIAAERGAHLVLLHAWESPMVDDDLLEREWKERARTDLEELVTRRSEANAEVGVEISIVHGQPAKAVVEASRTADLLLVTRRPLAFPFGSLGGTGRAILRESHCPVEVLPPATRRKHDGTGTEPDALGVMF